MRMQVLPGDDRPSLPAAEEFCSRRTGGSHSVQFYGNDAALVDRVGRFVGGALEAGDSAIVIATPEHRIALADRLTAQGLDGAAASGRYQSLDAAATLARITRDGRPDPALFDGVLGEALSRGTAASADDPKRIAVFGEMVALLWSEGKRHEAIRLEQLWNGLAHDYAFSLHCAYPMSLFGQAGDDEYLRQICVEHTGMIPTEGYTALTSDVERLRAIILLQQRAQALKTEIDERKQARQALHESNQQLREALAVRDAFLTTAAHELKTPITSLRAYAQLLLRDARGGREIAPGRLVAALDAIEQQTTRLSGLVRRLLDTSRIESGKLQIEPVATDLVALVRSALAWLPVRSGCQLVYDGPDVLAALVDPLQFEQVLTNLLDNAVKFSPDGGVVTVTLEQDAHGSIRLGVADEGEGIPSDQREAIFRRFYDGGEGRHQAGLGLGLYITRQIVERHGGSVHVEEPAHRGSRFVVTLPASASMRSMPSTA